MKSKLNNILLPKNSGELLQETFLLTFDETVERFTEVF